MIASSGGLRQKACFPNSCPAHLRKAVTTDVQALDAGGLGLLVSLHHWAEANRVQLKLANPRPFVREVLARTHLDRVFDISSFNDALAVLGGCEHRQAHAESNSRAAAY